MNCDEKTIGTEKKFDGTHIDSILVEYKNLKMSCPNCGKEHSVQVPANFNILKCEDCQNSLDPAFWYEDGLVDHVLMCKLISTCYKHTGFSKKVIELYERDYHHAKNEEFGINKSLLLIHAANALVQNGHHCKPLFWTSLFSLIPFVGAFIPIYLTSKRLYNNLEYRENFFTINSYDPTQIPLDNREKIENIVKFTDYIQPRNLFFFSQYNPFVQFGNNDGMWSFLVDRRKRTDGEITLEPAELDTNIIYSKIIERACKVKGTGVSQFRFHVDDILLVDGRLVGCKNEKLFYLSQYGYYPKELIDNEEIVRLQSTSGDILKPYKRITFYNPQRQLCIRSFIRVQHQGSFTYIESIGTQLLPLVDKLYDLFQEKTSSDELEGMCTGPNWWQALPLVRRKRASFIVLSMSAITIIFMSGFFSGLLNWFPLMTGSFFSFIAVFSNNVY